MVAATSMEVSTVNVSMPSQEFLIPNLPSLEYSLDMLSDFAPQVVDNFPPAPTAPVDFVADLFQLPSITNLTAEPQSSNALPLDMNTDVSGSSSGSPPSSPPKDSRPSQNTRDKQTSGRWNNRQRGPVSESRKLEVNREAQRRFRQRQKVCAAPLCCSTVRSFSF